MSLTHRLERLGEGLCPDCRVNLDKGTCPDCGTSWPLVGGEGE